MPIVYAYSIRECAGIHGRVRHVYQCYTHICVYIINKYNIPTRTVQVGSSSDTSVNMS